ncbi:hypothetical protein [Calothrix rhizosoleniae]
MSFVWTELRVDVKGEDVGGSLREIMTDIEEGEEDIEAGIEERMHIIIV